MTELFAAIQEWPVILQGAIGSGVFWLFLYIVQLFFKQISQLVSNLSRNARKTDLINERIKIQIQQSDNDRQVTLIPALLYRMSRPLVRALMWLVLGLAFAQISLILSFVGYIGSIYYLMKASEIVGPFNFGDDSDKRLAEIGDELGKLKDVDA